MTYIYRITFLGEYSTQKIRRVREELTKAEAECFVITVLEDSACESILFAINLYANLKTC